MHFRNTFSSNTVNAVTYYRSLFVKSRTKSKVLLLILCKIALLLLRLLSCTVA